MKQILVVSLYLEAKYSRNFAKLVERIKSIGADVAGMDFAAFASSNPEAITAGYRGVVLSGTNALYTRVADRGRLNSLTDFLPKVQIPMLGICGGHQALALAYGGTVVKMGSPVQGFRTVKLEDKDTLLAGLPARIKVMQHHAEEVKQLPPRFTRTATSSDTKIEGMKHEALPLYGVQFHPERWNEDNPAGKRILENFTYKIAV